MSCNTKTSLAAVIDAVNAQLNNNYVDRDDPRINQGVFTEPTIRGGLMLDEAAKLDFCGYVTECGQREPFGKQWVDRPLYPYNTLVSYADGGEIKSRWQGIDDVVAGTEIGESYIAYEETRRLGLQGYAIIDSFELGATLTQRNEALRHTADGKLYRWAGDLPKTVAIGSTPESSGGIGTNAWLEVSDSTYGQQLAQVETNKVNILSTTKTVTVGATGADFTTINAALSELSKFEKSYIKDNAESNTTATILLKSGFVAAEQININSIDFGWVDIVSEDPEVVISREALTTKIGRWYPFIRCKSGVIPSIKTLFSMDETGVAADRTALYLINSDGFIEAGAGFKNSGERNIDCTQTSNLCASGGIFTGAKELSVRPATGSSIFLQYADLSNSKSGLSCGTGANVAAEGVIIKDTLEVAVEAQGACNVDLSSSTLTGSGLYGLVASRNCIVNAASADISNGSGYGVYADNGASVDLKSATVNNCLGAAGVRAINGAKITGAGITATGNVVNLMATKGGSIVTDVAVLTGATDAAMFASEGGKITATNSNYRKGDADATTDAQVLFGGTLVLTGSTGGTSQKTDVEYPAGIIYKGIKRKARGQSAIPAGQTSVTTTHTLAEVPFILVTPIVSLGTATKWWVSNLTATSFVINIDATTASAATFHWSAELI